MSQPSGPTEPYRPELPLELPVAAIVAPSSDPAPAPTPSQNWWKPFRAKHPVSWIPTALLPFVLLPASLIMSAIVAIALLALQSSPEVLSDPERTVSELERMLVEPTGFFVSVLSMQLMMLVPIGLLALMSREGFRQRLHLTRGHLSFWTWPFLVLSIVSIGIGMDLITRLLEIEASDHLKVLSESISGLMVSDPWLVLFTIAFMPGLCEELCYRGYIQHRLVRSWNPIFGILFASTFFALAHFDPLHIALVFPMGIWLGIVSWRCGSIIPSILGHMANNGLASLFSIPACMSWSEENTTLITAVGLCCFVIGVLVIAFAPSSQTQGQPREPGSTTQ